MTAGPPSLLAFILARMDDEIELILMNTPIIVAADVIGVTQQFVDRYLDREALYERVKDEKGLVAQVVDAMTAEQQTSVGHKGPVTALGSAILKSLALRYADHPDYDHTWSPTT